MDESTIGWHAPREDATLQVLRIDELIFACFAPVRISMLVERVRPLRAPSALPTWRGLDFRSVASFVFCVTFASLVYWFFVLRQINILEKAQHAMCGGDLDAMRGVVYSRDERSRDGCPVPLAVPDIRPFHRWCTPSTASACHGGRW